MLQTIQVDIAAGFEHEEEALRSAICKQLKLNPATHFEYRIDKKSIDARKRIPLFVYQLRVYIRETPPVRDVDYAAQSVHQAPEIHIIGAGPAGLFCALEAITLGLKPILFERGKNVRDRRRDLASLNKHGILNEESNYCFGEGGAGTYSDGKLYTRSTKRGDVQQVLNWFHYFGASETILYEAHPHIGTNKLPHIIEAIREQIIACGGEIHFEHKLTDINLSFQRISEITLNGQLRVPVTHLILATGHSARDIYELLHRKGIAIESKPFALGVRIEHPQALIDSWQYHAPCRLNGLPPASYSLVEQVAERGVFSFCMCPGGIIAPAATQQGALVVNGWSPSKRNNQHANSGMVVSIDHRDYKADDPLSGLRYQQAVEEKAFQVGGGQFVAPAQRMVDFVQKKVSLNLPSCSYGPGVHSSNLHEVLPSVVSRSLASAFTAWQLKQQRLGRTASYYTNEAILVATESRTSSPVRIPRHKETLQHISVANLYPCAEGAGYAGGIVSAAMDGMRVAQQIATLVETI